MNHEDATAVASRCRRILEPLHSFVYFAPEAEERLTAAGLRPGRMCYFASRAAAMGAVGPGTVAATFYNFNPDAVAKYLPRAWGLATPSEVLDARLAAADSALRRLLGADVLDSPELARAADLAAQAAGACRVPGRPLFAAHADLPWPDEPHLRLWHAATLLREYRGDGHIAALLAADLGGLDALVTHTATGTGFRVPVAKSSRGWSDEQWEAAEAGLRERGVLGQDGTLTERGEALRAEIEAATNAADTAAWEHLGTEGTTELLDLAAPLTKQIAAGGAFPSDVFASGK